MTAHRDLKRITRERQTKTGESYMAARVHVMHERARRLGLDDDAVETTAPVRVDAVVLNVNRQSARVRQLSDDAQLTFRTQDIEGIVPGHLVTLVTEKRWTWRGVAHASGHILDPRIDVAKLSLEPLPLAGGEFRDLRDGYEPYRTPDRYAPLWRKLTAQPRPCFEMDPIA